jgi:hypothetical protein
MSVPYVISETNLSHAWGRALWHVAKNPGFSIQPLVISIQGLGADGEPEEDSGIRAALDKFLVAKKKWSVEIVAFTIFPRRYLQVSGGDRHAFYQICHDALPHLKATNPSVNSKGFYFERLFKFGRAAIDDNQIEFMLTEFLGGHRRTSLFQASIFDPLRDQTRQPYQSFPCLQSVSFVPTKEGLVVNAFYAMQYLIQRGYGNFLGLAHLGAFVAKEMGLPMAQLNIVAGVERLDFKKEDIGAILKAVNVGIPDLV